MVVTSFASDKAPIALTVLQRKKITTTNHYKMNIMKKFLSLSISLIVLLGMCSNASAQSAKINEAPYKSVTLNQRNPAYWQTEWEAQVYNYKMVRNFPTLYEKEAWDAAQSAGSLMLNIHPEALSDLNKEQILAA